VAPRPGPILREGDATQPSTLAPLIAGDDAVVSASRFQTSDANALINAVKRSGVKRLLVVGGAGSLEVAPGKALVDSLRLGGDQMLVDAKGKSWISMEDFAIAFVDELEHPKHSRQRFTVGY